MTPQIIEQAKKVSIIDYLYSLGQKPTRVTKEYSLFFSPFRNERTPSFSVTHLKYRDYGTGQSGDIIDLVMNLRNIPFQGAVEQLTGCCVETIQSYPIEMQNHKKLMVKSIKPLRSKFLIDYWQSRGIDSVISKKTLNEIHYSNAKSDFVSSCWYNTKGGIELRGCGNFKCAIGIKSHTVFSNGSDRVWIFEGMADYLTALQMRQNKGIFDLQESVIILNSVSTLTMELLNYISTFNNAYSFLDNDEAGEKALVKLTSNVSVNTKIKNISKELYPNHKDLNTYYQWQISNRVVKP